MRLRDYFHPHFLIKYYLRRDIQTIVQHHDFSGRILDVGCGEKPYREFFTKAKEYVGIDFKNYSRNNLSLGEKPDFYFPVSYQRTLTLPFSSHSFSHTVAFQVIEHHQEPTKLLTEMFRITKKNGFILLSFPFIWGLHETPQDYYRLTEYTLKKMTAGKGKIVLMKKQGSYFSTVSMLANDYLIEIMQRGAIFYVVGLLLYPIFLLYAYLAFVLDLLFRSENIFLNYVVLIKKL